MPNIEIRIPPRGCCLFIVSTEANLLHSTVRKRVAADVLLKPAHLYERYNASPVACKGNVPDITMI